MKSTDRSEENTTCTWQQNLQKGELGTLKIYQGEYEDRKLIVKVSEKEDLMCYERARDELESWVKRQEKESMWNKTA